LVIWRRKAMMKKINSRRTKIKLSLLLITMECVLLQENSDFTNGVVSIRHRCRTKQVNLKARVKVMKTTLLMKLLTNKILTTMLGPIQ